MRPVYLDYHATTPVDRRVLERMLPYFTETFGNPASSTHQWGWRAQEAVEQARREVARFIDAYNHRRRHSSCEMLPPVAYEALLAARVADTAPQPEAA